MRIISDRLSMTFRKLGVSMAPKSCPTKPSVISSEVRSIHHSPAASPDGT